MAGRVEITSVDGSAAGTRRAALRNIAEKWKNPPISWHAAKAQLAIQFEDRFVLSE